MSRYSTAYAYLQLGLALDKKLEDETNCPCLTSRGKTMLIRASFWTHIGINELAAVDYFDAMNTFLLAMSCRSCLSVRKSTKATDSKMVKLQVHLLLSIIGLTHCFYMAGKLRWGFESLNLLLSLYQGFPDLDSDMVIYIRNMATFYDNRHNKLMAETTEWEHVMLGERGNYDLNSRSLNLELAANQVNDPRKSLYGPRIEALLEQWRLPSKNHTELIQQWFFDKIMSTSEQLSLEEQTVKSSGFGEQAMFGLGTPETRLANSQGYQRVSGQAISELGSTSLKMRSGQQDLEHTRSTSRGSVAEPSKADSRSPTTPASSRKHSIAYSKSPQVLREKRTVWARRSDQIQVRLEDIMEPIPKFAQTSNSKDLGSKRGDLGRISGKKSGESPRTEQAKIAHLEKFLDIKRPGHLSLCVDLDTTAKDMVMRSLSTDFADTLSNRAHPKPRRLLKSEIADKRRIQITKQVEGTKRVAILCKSLDQSHTLSDYPSEFVAPSKIEEGLKFEEVKSQVMSQQREGMHPLEGRRSHTPAGRRFSPVQPLVPTQGSRLEHIMRNHPDIFNMPKFFSIKEHIVLDKAAFQEEVDKEMHLRMMQEKKTPLEHRVKADDVRLVSQ